VNKRKQKWSKFKSSEILVVRVLKRSELYAS